MSGAKTFAELAPGLMPRTEKRKRKDARAVASGAHRGVALAQVRTVTISKTRESKVDKDDMDKRLVTALGMQGKVAKATSLRAMLALGQADAVRKVMAQDPFAATEGGIASDLLGRLQHTRPDILDTPWPAAVEKLEAEYPGWVGATLDRAGQRPEKGSAQEGLRRAATEIQKRDPDVSDAQAYDRALTENPELAQRALAEEG